MQNEILKYIQLIKWRQRDERNVEEMGQREKKVKWVVSVIPISVNKLNMPNKALRASAWGGKKTHKHTLLLIIKPKKQKTKIQKKTLKYMDSERLKAKRKRKTMKVLTTRKWLYLD